MKKIVLIVTMLSGIFFGCKKSNSDDGTGGVVNGKVYAVGYLSIGDFYSRPRTAKIWVDTTETSLTDGTKDAIAIGVFLLGSDVYVTGYESNGTKNVAKLWKNGVATSLTDGTKNAVANGVCVVGADVYVVGFEAYGILGSDELTRPVVWKNGVSSYLPISGTDRIAVATSVCVQGTDVYVAGTEKVKVGSIYNYTAKLWKNGIATTISSANQLQKSSAVVTLSGNDVYTGCFEFLLNGTKNFTVQKNGVIVNTIAGYYPTPNSIENTYDYQIAFTVSGSDVYVAGGNSTPFSVVYKNGVEMPSLTSLAQSGYNCIAVLGTDVYFGGSGAGNTNQYKSSYVKNGVNRVLNNSVRNSQLLGMAIKN